MVLVVGGSIASFIAALAVLIVGWLVALIISAVVRAALQRTELANRIARWLAWEEKAREIGVERWTAGGVFYLIMLFVLGHPWVPFPQGVRDPSRLVFGRVSQVAPV